MLKSIKRFINWVAGVPTDPNYLDDYPEMQTDTEVLRRLAWLNAWETSEQMGEEDDTANFDTGE